MRNSTSLCLNTSLTQPILLKSLMAATFMLSAFLFCNAQTGIQIPSTPTGVPLQFNTNLNSSNTAGNTTLDGNVAVFDQTFSNAVDKLDGRKVVNTTNENFYLTRGGIGLVLEARMPPVTTDTLFYRMTNLKLQDYQLELYPANMNKPGLTAILVDKFLNTRTNISLIQSTTYYPFTITEACGCAAPDRFSLIFYQVDPGPLPVTFISITAAKSSTGVQVNWKVAGERGILNYSIEKSDDGSSFSSVGIIAAAGSGYTDRDITYGFKDITAVKSIQYYRIKSNGKNEVAKYSPIVKIITGSIRSSISVLTNPVRGSSINLQLTKVPQGKYELNLSGADGRLIFANYIQHTGESATYPVQLPSAVSRGTYILSVTSPDKTKKSQVILIDQGN
jgi:hypothetical protein